ncbi:aspartyl protease family protein [Stenotrophomonas maltophilia]|uniref:aspartyl protease family protein n=1 Tax=Stenotrophomonas maltophilia TaxID=40324 RepID=UPI0018D338B1|nr:clan AA aspartic protease [Stenotrophomonas maltophilia]HDS1301045.1 clan AA aspartic protease [Stenotrophomonas maltophilia]
MSKICRIQFIAILVVTALTGAPAVSAETIAIPFELGKDQRIYAEGTINQSRPLRFLVDTGADGMAVSLATRDLAGMKIDDQSENTGADGTTLVDYSTKNRVALGGASRTLGAAVIDYQNRPFDAVLGWKFFEGRVVEIDYDKMTLFVHGSLPSVVGYTRMKTRWIDNTPAIEVTLQTEGSRLQAWLSLDTGNNGTIDLSYAYSSRHNLKDVLTQKVGTSQFSGSAGKKIRSVDVRAPAVELQSLRLDQPKVSFTIDEDGSSGDGTIGSEVLRNFNILLDTNTGDVYLRPNGHLGSK